MRILLRDEGSGLFYFGRDNWTPDRALAYDFLSRDDVMLVARFHQLSRAQMVYEFENNPAMSFAIPLSTFSDNCPVLVPPAIPAPDGDLSRSRGRALAV